MSLVQKLRSIKTRRDMTATERSKQEMARIHLYDESWNRLRNRIKDWLANLTREDLATFIETKTNEGATAIHIDVVDVDAGTLRLSLNPLNVRVIGAEGRVDVFLGTDRLYSLLLIHDGHWELFDVGERKVVNRSFTALDIESLLEQLILLKAVEK